MARLLALHPGTLRPPRNSNDTSRHCPVTISNLKCGPSIAPQTSKTALRWLRRRLPALNADSWMQNTYTKGQSGQRERIGSSTTKGWPTNWPHDTIWGEALKQQVTPIFG